MFSPVFSLQKNECFLYFESSSSLYRFKYRSYRIYYQIHAIKHDHKASEKSTKMITDNAFISIPDESRKRNMRSRWRSKAELLSIATGDTTIIARYLFRRLHLPCWRLHLSCLVSLFANDSIYDQGISRRGADTNCLGEQRVNTRV